MLNRMKRLTPWSLVGVFALCLGIGAIAMRVGSQDDSGVPPDASDTGGPERTDSLHHDGSGQRPESSTRMVRGVTPTESKTIGLPVVASPHVESAEEPAKESEAGRRSAREEAKEREIRALQDALPENMHVPYKRSKEELQLQMADIQEQQQLFAAIESNKATTAEHQRYYELQAKRFEDEIALAEYCEKTVSGISQEEFAAHPLCAEVASRVNETRLTNAAALAELRQSLHLESGQP
jgi:hypothetical protein